MSACGSRRTTRSTRGALRRPWPDRAAAISFVAVDRTSRKAHRPWTATSFWNSRASKRRRAGTRRPTTGRSSVSGSGRPTASSSSSRATSRRHADVPARSDSTTRIPVIVEVGTKRVFASAAEWPGWARRARDEASALDALAAYAPRYASVVSHARLGFSPPADASSFRVVERLAGNATTDYGVPGVHAKIDAAAVGAADLPRLEKLLTAGLRAIDAGVADARETQLRAGARGGRRSLTKNADHRGDAEGGYLSALGWPL